MKTLLVGYRAADLAPQLLQGDVTCHTLDIYHRHAIEKVHHVKAVCTPHLPEGPWDCIKFKTGPKIHSGELALDLLQEAVRLRGRDAPAPSRDAPVPSTVRVVFEGGKVVFRGGDVSSPRLEIDFDGRERDRNDLIGKIKDDPKRVRSFKAEWPASVPGGEKLMFTSYPGCFCHRRLDEGGLALAEVVSRELQDFRRETQDLRILDMGCGCGLVGLLVVNRLNRTIEQSEQSNNPSISLVLVDSHARAVEAATENAAKFGIPAEVILSDNGTPARMDGTFDVFVGNPPYYSDYRIAEVFLETAKRALKPGGVCYTVVKNAAGLRPVQEKFFKSVAVTNRRCYSVLKSVKEA